MNDYFRIKKKDRLKCCLYYKGEEECPDKKMFRCTQEKYYVYRRYWHLESEFYSGGMYRFDRLYQGRKLWGDRPDIINFVEDSRWNKIQKLFLYTMIVNVVTQTNSDPNFILDYGKCTNLRRKPEPKPKTAWEGMMEICRYYRGGKVNPYPWGTAKAHFWELEWEFANNYYQKDQRLENEYNLNVIAAFPDQLAKAPYGVIYLPLKAFLHARYYNFGGSDAGFPAYLDYYLKNQ